MPRGSTNRIDTASDVVSQPVSPAADESLSFRGFQRSLNDPVDQRRPTVTISAGPQEIREEIITPTAIPPSAEIEGLTLPSAIGGAQEPVQTGRDRVSIVEDSADSSVFEKIKKSIVGTQPTVLSVFKFPNITTQALLDSIQVNQFERQMLKEIMVRGVTTISENSGFSEFADAAEIKKDELDLLDQRLEALSYLLGTIERASAGLSPIVMSDEIMKRASDTLTEIIAGSELSIGGLPESIDDYIALSFPNGELSSAASEYLTNTARIVALMQDMFLGAVSMHPTLLGNQLSRQGAGDARLFSTPGKFAYESPGGVVEVPTLDLVFRKNDKSIIQQYNDAINSVSLETELPTWTLASGDVPTQNMWDTVCQLVSAISGELILSAGISRLQGTALGNRFLSYDNELDIYRPFDAVFGTNPTSTSDKISKFYSTGPEYNGSALDLLALGEEARDEKFVVMPFEDRSVSLGSVTYVSGKKYFVDLALQDATDVDRESLKRFSTELGSFMNDASSYITNILSLDENSKLFPQSIFVAVLEDIMTVLKEMQKDDPDKRDLYAAGLCAATGADDNARNNKLLKAAVVLALQDLDESQTNGGFSIDYTLSRDKTSMSAEGSSEFRSTIRAKGSRAFALGSWGWADRESALGAGRAFEFNVSDSESLKTLHDKDFSSGGNLINSIAVTIRELQREAFNFAKKEGDNLEYRNASNGTLMSNCDDDRFAEVVCELYARLAALLIPITVKISDQEDDVLYDKVYIGQDKTAARAGILVIQSVINAVLNGSDLDEAVLLGEVQPGNEINGRIYGKASTASQLVDATQRLPKHRFYLKASLKILESISASVSAASAGTTRIFNVLEGRIPEKEMNEQEKVLFDMFVTRSDEFGEVLQNISPFQVNLSKAARSIHDADPAAGEIFLRRDLYLTKYERLALKVFAREIMQERNLDDLYLMSVGMPSGLMGVISEPTLSLENNLAINSSRIQPKDPLVRISIDRYDEVYNTVDGQAVADIGYDPSAGAKPFEFDPEIYILPDSIKYDPAPGPTGNRDYDPAGSMSRMDEVFRSTTFYKIRSGKVIRRVRGDELGGAEYAPYANALKSHLLDLLLYETANIRYYDSLGPVGPVRLNSGGYQVMRAASADPGLASLLAMRPGFIDIFDRDTFEVRSESSLYARLTDIGRAGRGTFSRQDLKFAAIAGCISPLCESGDVIRYRRYDRVFHFLYDESIMRGFIGGDDYDRQRKRKQFDIFTLTARITYQGGEDA